MDLERHFYIILASDSIVEIESEFGKSWERPIRDCYIWGNCEDITKNVNEFITRNSEEILKGRGFVGKNKTRFPLLIVRYFWIEEW